MKCDKNKCFKDARYATWYGIFRVFKRYYCRGHLIEMLKKFEDDTNEVTIKCIGYWK